MLMGGELQLPVHVGARLLLLWLLLYADMGLLGGALGAIATKTSDGGTSDADWWLAVAVDIGGHMAATSGIVGATTGLLMLMLLHVLLVLVSCRMLVFLLVDIGLLRVGILVLLLVVLLMLWQMPALSRGHCCCY
jgi:hypothetical protein